MSRAERIAVGAANFALPRIDWETCDLSPEEYRRYQGERVDLALNFLRRLDWLATATGVAVPVAAAGLITACNVPPPAIVREATPQPEGVVVPTVLPTEVVPTEEAQEVAPTPTLPAVPQKYAMLSNTGGLFTEEMLVVPTPTAEFAFSGPEADLWKAMVDSVQDIEDEEIRAILATPHDFSLIFTGSGGYLVGEKILGVEQGEGGKQKPVLSDSEIVILGFSVENGWSLPFGDKTSEGIRTGSEDWSNLIKGSQIDQLSELGNLLKVTSEAGEESYWVLLFGNYFPFSPSEEFISFWQGNEGSRLVVIENSEQFVFGVGVVDGKGELLGFIDFSSGEEKMLKPIPTPEPTEAPPTPTPEPAEPTPTQEAEVESQYRQVEDGKYVYITESREELVIPEMANAYQKFALVDGKPFVIYLAEDQNPWGLTGETPQEKLVGIAFPETYIADRDESGAEIREQVCAVGLIDKAVRPRLKVASVEELEIPLFVDPTTASGENPQLVLQFSAGQNTGRTNMFIVAPRGSTLVVPFEIAEKGEVLVSRNKQSWGGSTMKIGNERGIFSDSVGRIFNLYVWSADPAPIKKNLQLGSGFSVVKASSFSEELLEGYQRIFEPDPVGGPNFSVYLKSLLEDGQGKFPATSFVRKNISTLENGSPIFMLANNANRQVEIS